eukprot:TRINITY_DN2724_c0_g1_i1.p1 TRINITY_DN2724_c0_g1~~TRINITY_DN2724_c0_g1_i1.p1  ORF type:complete len:100 (-),score=36.84 TRINITY_DN2724_c0_g1_i1:73-372(-)
MVHQKPVTFVTKSKVRKNLKTDKKANIKDLAGPREALAMEALHTMFMKSLAQQSNFVAFQNRKNIVDQKTMLVGAAQALEASCPRFSLDTDDESSGAEV